MDDVTPTLTSEDGGDRTASLQLTNLNRAAVAITIAGAETPATGCEFELSRAAVGAAQSAEVELTASEDCALTDDELRLTLTATAGDVSQEIDIAPEASPDAEDPNWMHLIAFPAAWLLAMAYLYRRFTSDKEDSDRAVYPRQRTLDHLETTFSFKDSWVSTVTVLGSLVTAIFGSADVVKAFLGEDADKSIALATVGSAVALALIGLGPIVLTALKRAPRKEATGRPDLSARVFTVEGILAATSFTVAGAAGLLWIGTFSALQLDLSGVQWAAVIIGPLGLALLAWCTHVSVKATLQSGTIAPPAKPTEVARLIAIVESALTADPDYPNSEITQVTSGIAEGYPRSGTSLGDEPLSSARRRAALP